jgi:hypothetical protein
MTHNTFPRRTHRHPVARAAAACAVLLLAASWCAAAVWQYRAPFERGPDRRGRTREPGHALLWLPPESARLRGLLLAGRLGIEGELVVDPAVRAACAGADVGIVYFAPHLSGVFHFWEDGNRDGETLLATLDALAARSGRPEVRRVPWITAGHSTAGIFARNVAYWRPKRVAGILHLKSGNFHQEQHLPPEGSLAGVPLVAINGQFETFGPEGGLRPEFGRQTQWVFVRRDIQRFRAADGDHLMALLVQPGADHFHGGPEVAAAAARFIRRAAVHRLPTSLPAGPAPVPCRPTTREDGWLTDPDLYAPAHPPAPYAEYAGEKAKAFWHLDRESAEAAHAMHRTLGGHQVLANPTCEWLDAGDGWTFRARSAFLDTMPEKYGGTVGGQKVGHAGGSIVYRAKINEPVRQIGPDTFRLLRPVKRVHVAAYHPGDAAYRSTIRWGRIAFRPPKGAAGQTITFPPVPDVPADGGPVALKARTDSGLPVHYEVDYGPVEVKDGTLVVSEVPARAAFPLQCRVTAHQVGRRTAPAVAPAEAVSVTFEVLAPAR